MTDSRSQPSTALVADCKRYAAIIEGIIVVADDWKPGDVERREPRETLLKAADCIESLVATLRWIEAHDRMWTSAEYEKGNEVLDRSAHNIKIRGSYGAAANLALKHAALPQSRDVAR